MNPSAPDPRPAPQTAPSGRWHRLATPFRMLAGWFRHQPRGVRISILVVLLAGAATGAYFGRSFLAKNADQQELSAAWRSFDEAGSKTDLDAMRVALDRVLAIQPADPTAIRYRAILDRGESEPDTPQLAVVLLAHFVRTDRLAEAAREAEKVLARYPKDWQARCVTAHHALQVTGDRALAERRLAELPDPEDPAAMVTLGGVLYALRLSDILGHDGHTLRRVIVRRLVPLTRSSIAANAPAGAKVQLVACYLEPFADRTSLGELAAFWASADKLAEDATTEAVATGDLAVLTRLGELGPRMRLALAALREDDPTGLTDDRFREFLRAVDDRTRRAWQAARTKAPDRSDAYLGLALLAHRAGDLKELSAQVRDGLAACGEQPELVESLVGIAARYGTREANEAVADAVWKSAEAAKSDPAKWCLAARVALVVHRADLALQACANARQVSPRHPWVCSTEAMLWITRGDFAKARAALQPLGDAAVRSDPTLARFHARILVGLNEWPRVESEFKLITLAEAELKKPKSAYPTVGFLLGVLDAPPSAPRAAWVAARADAILANDPRAPLVGRIHAEALFRLADLSAKPNPRGGELPPVWDADRVTAAVRAIDLLAVEDRADLAVVAAVAALQLKGQRNEQAALRTVAVLLANEANLSGAQLEIVGATLAANDRGREAVRILKRAAELPEPSAGCLAALAEAYRVHKQPVEAAAALRAAESVAGRSDREHAELIATKLRLLREKP